MKNLTYIICILIIFFKTGNVLSNNDIFNVNNIEINKEIYKNKDNLVNQAFKNGFKTLIKRLLLEKDYKRISNTDLDQIKKLISYYQIFSSNEEVNSKNIKLNIFFDKKKFHNFFYEKNILYSDIINTEVILFPLLIVENQVYIYAKNFFYKNWNKLDSNNLIEYTLPVESIENIQKIESKKNNIYQLNISDFFKEYETKNMVFTVIEISESIVKVFLNTNISGKNLKKTLSINTENISQKDLNNKIIL